MRASRRVLAFAGVFLLNFCLSSFAAAQPADQVAAERVLGPHWKELSRRAGMIFAGTVLTTAPKTETTQTVPTDRPIPGTAPAIELTFRVDEAIAGVERGQVLTIHEWAGAWSMHRPMSKGQHILIFLYPPSRLGLTSPVGGPLGQVALDPSGKNVSVSQSRSQSNSNDAQKVAASLGSQTASPPQPLVPINRGSVSVVQLARGIRSAREE